MILKQVSFFFYSLQGSEWNGKPYPKLWITASNWITTKIASSKTVMQSKKNSSLIPFRVIPLWILASFLGYSLTCQWPWKPPQFPGYTGHWLQRRWLLDGHTVLDRLNGLVNNIQSNIYHSVAERLFNLN